MFFLIRTAFWLSIVIMLLPTPESAKVPEFGRRRRAGRHRCVGDGCPT